MATFVNKQMTAWGNYPKQVCSVYKPEMSAEVGQIVQGEAMDDYIAYGLGRSYGDVSLNEGSGVIVTERLKRMLRFDEAKGWLTCEAGVSLRDIIDVFLPQGYFLPVTPGTTYVTVGGAIANDVHGKNHHVEGNFSEFVVSFKLLLASGDIVTCSREENRELFWATVGGIGLTGIILEATIELMPVDSAYIDVTYERAQNLDEAFEKFAEGDRNYRYSVAWIDCLRGGNSLGRSVLMRGDHASRETVLEKGRDPYAIKKGLPLAMPIYAPSFLLNQYSIATFNEVYYRSFRDERKVVDLSSFFHPLDAISDWNKLYGKQGFIQYQAVFPVDKEPKEGIRRLLEVLSEEKRASFLAVLKRSGAANDGLLSFLQDGYTLALDLPIKGRAIFSLVRKLDEIVLAHGGRVYLAKDATLDEATFKTMYPEWERFMDVRDKVDPGRKWNSSMARRIGLV